MDEGGELGSHVGGVAHSLVPVTDNSLGNKGGEVVVRLPGDTLNSNGDVCGWDGLIEDTDLGSDELWLALLLSGELGRGLRVWLRWKTGEVLLGELNELGVWDTTSTDEDHAVSGVVGLDVVNEILALDGLDVLGWAKDGAAEWLSLESGGVKVVENNLLELLVNLLRLAEDNVALALNSALVELGVLENVGENVDGRWNISVEGLGVVNGGLALYGISECCDVYSAVFDVRMCMRSSVLPCSQSRAPTAAVCGWRFPARHVSPSAPRMPFRACLNSRTLKARCSKKCAVPLVLSVSARDPASIQTPTVEVCAHGECSVAIYVAVSQLTPSEYVESLRAYGESVGQSCTLGLDAVVALLRDWGSEASLQCWGGELGWLAQALGEVECQSGGHGE